MADPYPPTAAYKQFISSAMRTDGGPGFWLTCDRPFEDAATDYTRSAYHALRPVAILGKHQRSRHPSAPALATPTA